MALSAIDSSSRVVREGMPILSGLLLSCNFLIAPLASFHSCSLGIEALLRATTIALDAACARSKKP